MIAQPRTVSSALALQLYDAAIKALAPERVIASQVHLDGSWLHVGSERFDLSLVGRLYVFGAGKASFGLAKAIVDLLGDRVHGGLIVTKHGHGGRLDRVRVIESDHPIPGEASFRAGIEMGMAAAETKPNDLALFLLSGGASALMESPLAPLTLLDLRQMNQTLLSSGADIRTLNAVRSSVSGIKAGGLAKAFAARVVCLVLSDVLGNDLDVVGSGPFRPRNPLGKEVAEQHGLYAKLPPQVRHALNRPVVVPPSKVPHVLIGDIETSLKAVALAAKDRGIALLRLPEYRTGEAQTEAKCVPDWIQMLSTRSGPCALLAAGEMTVTFTEAGKGGRCQEFAAAASPYLQNCPDTALLAGSTDGTDGPTDVAAAWVDSESIRLANRAGTSLERSLRDHDTHTFMSAAQGLVITGPTQSNVNDLYLVVRSTTTPRVKG